MLCVCGFAVQFDCYRVAMQGTPGLDVSAINSQRGRCAELDRHGRIGESVRQPSAVHRSSAEGVPRFQHGAQPEEQAVDPVVGLMRVMVAEAQNGPLVVCEGVDNPGDLDQVGLVVAGHGVQLEGHEQPPDGDGQGTSNLCVQERLQDRDRSGADHQPAGDLQIGGASRRPSAGVQGCSGGHSSPRSKAAAAV